MSENLTVMFTPEGCENARRIIASERAAIDADAALRLRLKQEKELQDALDEFGPITAGIVEEIQKLENAKSEADKERDRGFTIAGLDAAIARESGDSDLADQIERVMAREGGK